MLHKLYRKIYQTAYYKYASLLLHKKVVELPLATRNKKNLFLYFDYEREFGNANAIVSDKDIKRILDILDTAKLKATWFTVGKIFEHYPESIEEIRQRGHELASHTYGHINPFYTDNKKMAADFAHYKCASTRYGPIAGFHAPNGMWSMGMVKPLINHGFLYDVVTSSKGEQQDVTYCTFPGRHSWLRLRTLGDDWFLFRNKVSQNAVLNHFKSTFNNLRSGKIAGIGFHPWLLVSNEVNLNAFREFIIFLKDQKEVNIQPAGNYIKEISVDGK